MPPSSPPSSPPSTPPVSSSPQALAQVEGSLTRLVPQVVREAVDDTAGAAKVRYDERT